MNIIEARAVLNIAPPFTSSELLSAYRKEASFRHPDRGGSERLFTELTDAYNFMKALASLSTDAKSVTIDGIPLSQLGKGYPLTKNACTCSTCDGKGYTEETRDREATIECPKCSGHGIISHKCKKCDGTGKVGGKPCRTCSGSGRFFPRLQDKEIIDRTSVLNSGRLIEIRASQKMPNMLGRICFECDGEGRIPYEDYGFLDFRTRKTSGIQYVLMMMKTAHCSQDEAKRLLDFQAEASQRYFSKCSNCRGIGEIEMFNPVMPRGMLGGNR